MILPECQDAFNRLMRYFAWLVDEYGFAVINCETGTMRYCGFTLRAGSCLLHMDVERGYLQFGSLAFASVVDQKESAVPGTRWYNVGEVIDYLRGRYLSWSEIEDRNHRLLSVSEEESMTRLANDCHTMWPQIMELFQETEFKRRQADLEEFLQSKERDLHAQYMEAARRREAE